jgi:ribosome-binding factor A
MRSELKDPRVAGLVTVTGVEVSADIAHAKVFVTVLDDLGDPQATVQALNHCAAFLRSQLSQLMTLRSVPMLKFVYDASVDRGVRLTRLIEAAVGERRQDAGEDPAS